MFPNDDICTKRAARESARSLFQKYQDPNNPTGTLGAQEVSRMVKDVYGLLNIQIDPENCEVNSFMSVFNPAESTGIKVDELEKMAVKYLCGDEQPVQVPVHQNQSTLIREQPISMKSQLSPSIQPPSQNLLQKRQCSQTSLKASPMTLLLRDARRLFEFYAEKKSMTIDVENASGLLSQTYVLIGRSFKPTKKDIQVWFKLCDSDNDGKINWKDYQEFFMKVIERQGII